MKVLVVARSKSGRASPFVEEQAAALATLGVAVEMLLVGGRRLSGYLRFAVQLADRIASERFDIVHAHYGITGLFACFQRRVPVVVTFHGSDVNYWPVRLVSRIAARRAAASIVVSHGLAAAGRFRRAPAVVPCGVDPATFFPEDYDQSRAYFQFGAEKIIVFAGSRDRRVKNYPLAAAAVERVPFQSRLVELAGLTRSDVRLLLSAADVLLMSSEAEGSPQVVKEALMCGCPVVSTDVGDVGASISGMTNCRLAPSTPEGLASALAETLADGRRVGHRVAADRFSAIDAAMRIITLYREIVSEHSPDHAEVPLSEEAGVRAARETRPCS